MRGQVSVEFLVILSVTLLALLVFISLTQSESAALNVTKEKTNAYNAVRTLGAAADEVYAQGAGARKKVTVDIPSGYEQNESYVKGSAIKLRASGNDYLEIKDFEVYGSFPSTPGKHDVWVSSEGGKVRIGTALIQVNRETINLIMGLNDSRSESFTVSNVGNSTVTVSISHDWNNPNVSMGLADTAFLLPVGGSDITMVKFSTGASTTQGFYTGSLNITGNDGTGNIESVILPLTVEVSVNRVPEGGPPLTVLPSMFNATLKQGSFQTRTFQVCTNSETSLSSVDFSPSENWPGSWVGMTSSLSGIGTGDCRSKSLSVSVAGDAGAGNWTGYVYVTGNGAPEAEDVIVLHIMVERMINESDTTGPLVSDLSVFPARRKIFMYDPVAIRVTADDNLKGNNSISGCELRVGNSSWYGMEATDGLFNEPVEDASYTFFSGFETGIHAVSARCKDANNNTGPIVNSSFAVYREFLFITENSTPTTEEAAWINWINNGTSNMEYIWKYDTVNSTAFMNGSPSLGYYTTVVAERWVNGMDARLVPFVGSGGSLVLLGHSLENGMITLGVSNSSEIPADYSNLNFYNGSHYITQGIIDKNKISPLAFLMGRFSNFNGTILISGPGIPAGFHMMGLSGQQYFWGPTTPDNFNEIGMNVTTRMFDHAINASVNG